MKEDVKSRVAELRAQLKAARGISVETLASVESVTQAHGGELVSVTALDPDGDWCGTGRLRFKWPPKGGSIGPVIDEIIRHGIGGNIIINGTPIPHEVMIEISRFGR